MKEYKTRKLNRLKEYDYSLIGNYYVTICSKNRKNIFGEIINDEKSVGANGCWPDNTENIRHEIKLDKYVIISNHLHCIIIINRAASQPPLRTTSNIINQKQTLSSFVSGFKSVVTKCINILRDTPQKPVWQRSFYGHIIRTTDSLNNVRTYIINNPAAWNMDENNIKNYSLKGKACLAPTGQRKTRGR